MTTQTKPRVAFFDFACCEGCQLEVLSLEEQLLDMVELVDIVTWREAMSEKSDEYDIAFCEGSITCAADVERIKAIRETADILVSLGACATIGCHNALKNQFSMDEVLHIRPELIEHQLAHAVRDPNGRAYNRTAHLSERKEMMQKWADYLDGLRADAKVIPIDRSA